ncbi:MAG TPA: formimidoylglutamate deiminase [Pyrinomonadaceae bacterium]|jgi:formimidoylglutamate deiminase
MIPDADILANRNVEYANTVWLPDLLYTGGRFRSGMALISDVTGRIICVVELPEELFRSADLTPGNIVLPKLGLVIAARFVRLRGRALLPGLVNAHSHAFQRVIRGRTEYRSAASRDSFWTWRELMYSAAARLTPEDIYDASRMAFLEMLASGITAVGEFHYLQHTPEGTSYDDPNLLAKEVVRAARDAGLRIALLRVAYARSGYGLPPEPRQSRFVEPEVETYLRRVEELRRDLGAQETGGARSAWVGCAPHSVRAVPLEYLRSVCAFAESERMPVHMHVAEQQAELKACVEEYGQTPVALLDAEGFLSERFTAVHGVHITTEEARALARRRSLVCACPTTERNLGDGIVPADLLFQTGARIALGTDSHTQIDLLEDARELEYHLRLQKQERNVLAPQADERDASEASDGARIKTSALAARLFECATRSGAESIGAEGGELAAGRPADFFTVALDDPSIAGASAEDLLSVIIFSLARTAVREVAVGGRFVVDDGRHADSAEIVERFAALQRKLWSEDK